MADIVIVNKVDTANNGDVEAVERGVRELNPRAKVMRADSPITVANPDAVKGKRVLVVEDGPTLTHGGMAFGAGWLAARDHGATEIVDPRAWAVGSITDTFAKWPNTGAVLPAMGYGARQTAELAETIEESDADTVVIGTPIDLRRLIAFSKPAARVRYELEEIGEPTLVDVVRDFLASRD